MPAKPPPAPAQTRALDKRENLRTRPPMERIFRIHALLQEGKYPNARSLSDDFEVSQRTILRDLEFMRDRMCLPLEYHATKYGFYYSKPVDALPLLRLSEDEIFSMLVTEKALEHYRGTPLSGPLHSAFEKIRQVLDTNKEYEVAGMDEIVSVRPFGVEDADLKRFEVLRNAIRKRRVLKMRYRNLGRTRPRNREIEPLHLACVNQGWYLFAWDRERYAMRTFSLLRMEVPEETGEVFRPRSDFNLQEHLQNSLGVFRGEADFEVKLRFDAWAADLIRGRRWHASQEIEDLPRNEILLRLRLGSLEEIERWVLSWGGHVTVLGPDQLIKRIQESARQILGMG